MPKVDLPRQGRHVPKSETAITKPPRRLSLLPRKPRAPKSRTATSLRCGRGNQKFIARACFMTSLTPEHLSTGRAWEQQPIYYSPDHSG